jgi:hypothetical protein
MEDIVSQRHFITFRNYGYSSPERILQQARDSGFFDSVSLFTNKDIFPQLLKYPLHFFIRRRQGFGKFIWKPYVILKKLSQIPDGDVVIYSDLGTHISSAGRSLYDDYLQSLIEADKSLGVFSVGESYESSHFVYKRAVDSYNPRFYEDHNFSSSVYAGLLLVRKTANATQMISDWLALCERYLTPVLYRRQGEEIPEFGGQDADSGFLPLVLSKHDDSVVFPGEQVNLYSKDGIQLKHVLSPEAYEALDWKSLDKSPFTIRRDR